MITEVKLNGSIDLGVNRVRKQSVRRTDNENASMQKRQRSDDNIVKQLNDAIKYAGGQYVRFNNVDHIEGLLVAGAVDISVESDIKTNKKSVKKYFFVILNKDRQVEFVDSDDSFTIIRHNIPSSLYVLNYVYKSEPLMLLNRVDGALEGNMKPVTAISMYVPKAKSKNNKKSIKNKKGNKKSNNNTKKR